LFEQLKPKISARAVRLLMSPLPRRFISQREASTTVEFGLLAAPFVALIFAILQTAILFFADQSLETAAATAARLIMTGQAQTQGWTAAQFKSHVCSAITGLLLGEAQYSYTPSYGYVVTGTLTLSDKIYMRPRQSSSVARKAS
jgi:Flp pilus assembly protein TadG